MGGPALFSCLFSWLMAVHASLSHRSTLVMSSNCGRILLPICTSSFVHLHSSLAWTLTIYFTSEWNSNEDDFIFPITIHPDVSGWVFTFVIVPSFLTPLAGHSRPHVLLMLVCSFIWPINDPSTECLLRMCAQERFITWINTHKDVQWVPLIEMARSFKRKVESQKVAGKWTPASRWFPWAECWNGSARLPEYSNCSDVTASLNYICTCNYWELFYSKGVMLRGTLLWR